MKKTAIALLATFSLLLGGCAATETKVVRLAAHDSFAISDEAIESFESTSGYRLEIIRAGDAGSLTNRLVLTKASPIADAFFGIDNTFRSVAEENELVDGNFTAIDYADVCFNYDLDWFAREGITPPTHFSELTESKYRGLTVLTNPASSSPGLAFLATTVSYYGDPGYLQYWKNLNENGVLVSSSWEDAYFTQFSGSAGKGNYPIVLSYSSSPAAEIRGDGKSQTAAMAKDCFRQTEFAGVLRGASNVAGARALIRFLAGKEFQNSVAELMYVYPVNTEASIPAQWSEFGRPASSTIGSELDIAKNRASWITAWSEIFG